MHGLVDCEHIAIWMMENGMLSMIGSKISYGNSNQGK